MNRIILALVGIALGALVAVPSAHAQSLGGFAFQLRPPLALVGPPGPGPIVQPGQPPPVQTGQPLPQAPPGNGVVVQEGSYGGPVPVSLTNPYVERADRAERMTGLRLFLDPVFGALIGTAGWAIGAGIGGLIGCTAGVFGASSTSELLDYCIVGVSVGGGVGWLFAVPGGVAVGGLIGQGVGNYGMALLGSLLGMLVGIPVNIGIAYGLRDAWVGSLVGGIFPIIGATIFYEIASAGGAAELRAMGTVAAQFRPSVAPVFGPDGSVVGGTLGVAGTNF